AVRRGALVRKEFLLLTRDYHALAVLFLMPALFVLLVAFALAAGNQDRLPALRPARENPQAGDRRAFFPAALRQQLPDGHMPDASGQPLPRVRLSADFAGQLLDTEQASLGLVFPAATDALTRQRLRAAVQVALAQTRLMTFLLDSGE